MSANNKNGFALIGLLLAVVAIGLLAYGGWMYTGKKVDDNNLRQNVKRQLDDINKKNNELNKLKSDSLDLIEQKATSTE